MKQYRIGILGATGAVGREMMKVLEERKFPISELRLLAGAGSAGKRISFMGKEHTVIQASEDAFEGLDIVLGAAENDIAMRFAPAIVKTGAVFVDNSSAFRLYEDVPLVVSEINPEDVHKHRGIIANPNCTTIISLVALNALNKESPIESIIASSYQAVSGAGAQGISELSEETAAIAAGEAVKPSVFPYQIAYNVIPQIGSEAFMGYTSVPQPQRILIDTHQGENKRSACAGADSRRGGLPPYGRYCEPRLPHAARYIRSGSGLCGPHTRRPDGRARA